MYFITLCASFRSDAELCELSSHIRKMAGSLHADVDERLNAFHSYEFLWLDDVHEHFTRFVNSGQNEIGSVSQQVELLVGIEDELAALPPIIGTARDVVVLRITHIQVIRNEFSLYVLCI